MQLTELNEPIIVTDSDLSGSSFSGVALRDVRFEDARMTVGAVRSHVGPDATHIVSRTSRLASARFSQCRPVRLFTSKTPRWPAQRSRTPTCPACRSAIATSPDMRDRRLSGERSDRRLPKESVMPKLTIDGIEVEVPAGSTVLQAAEAAGIEIPAVLLSRPAVDRRQLPHVPGRNRKDAAETNFLLHLSRRRGHGRAHRHADGAQRPPRRDGIPADQSPAGLPDLRSGRRVRSAGSGHGLRHGPLALCREQARGARTRISGRW